MKKMDIIISSELKNIHNHQRESIRKRGSD